MSKVIFYIEVNSDSGDLGPFFQVDADTQTLLDNDVFDFDYIRS